MNEVYDTFLTKSDWAYDHIVPISPDASNRKYFRLTSCSGSAILMDAELESSKSFDAFQDVAHYLNSIGLTAPEIYESDRANPFDVASGPRRANICPRFRNRPDFRTRKI